MATAWDEEEDWEKAGDLTEEALKQKLGLLESGVPDSWEEEEEEEAEELDAGIAKVSSEPRNADKKAKQKVSTKPKTVKGKKEAEEAEEYCKDNDEEVLTKEQLRKREIEADMKITGDLFNIPDDVLSQSLEEKPPAEKPKPKPKPEDDLASFKGLEKHEIFTFVPKTPADFEKFATILAARSSLYATNKNYPKFVETYVKLLVSHLTAEQVKNVVKVLQVSSNTKVAQEKQSKKKTQKKKIRRTRSRRLY